MDRRLEDDATRSSTPAVAPASPVDAMVARRWGCESRVRGSRQSPTDGKETTRAALFPRTHCRRAFVTDSTAAQDAGVHRRRKIPASGGLHPPPVTLRQSSYMTSTPPLRCGQAERGKQPAESGGPQPVAAQACLRQGPASNPHGRPRHRQRSARDAADREIRRRQNVPCTNAAKNQKAQRARERQPHVKAPPSSAPLMRKTQPTRRVWASLCWRWPSDPAPQRTAPPRRNGSARCRHDTDRQRRAAQGKHRGSLLASRDAMRGADEQAAAAPAAHEERQPCQPGRAP